MSNIANHLRPWAINQWFRVVLFGCILSQSRKNPCGLILVHDFGCKYIRKELLKNLYSATIFIELNKIYKIMYYKYKLLSEVIDIIDVKLSLLL